MVSYIIISKDKKKRNAYVQNYAMQLQINRIDISVIEKEITPKQVTQNIGIEYIKILRDKIFLKPISSTDKMIIIEDAQYLTPEAQNALLKILEEPPMHTYIFLSSDTKETLLPTILSRCQIIALEEEEKKISDTVRTEILSFIREVPEYSINSRLKYAERVAKDKEKAIVWIEEVILILRDKLISIFGEESEQVSSSQTLAGTETIRKLQSLLTLLKTTNVNPRFAIEHTLLFL